MVNSFLFTLLKREKKRNENGKDSIRKQACPPEGSYCVSGRRIFIYIIAPASQTARVGMTHEALGWLLAAVYGCKVQEWDGQYGK